MTALYTPLNQLATTLGSGYTAASGSLVLASGYGSQILAEIAAEGAPAISSSHPIRVSVIAAAHANDNPILPAFRTIFSATGLSGDTLTGITAIEGTTDRNYTSGDTVRFNLTAGSVVDLNTMAAAAAAAIAGLGTMSTQAASAVAITGGALGGVAVTTHTSPIHTDTDGATVTFDLSVTDWHQVTLGGNRTLALASPGAAQQFTIVLIQDGTGSRTVTWFGGIKWPGGTVPTLTTAAGKADVFTFKQIGTGSYYGFIAGQNL